MIHQFEAHSGSVTYAEYIHKENIVITSGSDNALMFWRPKEDKTYQLVNRISTREIQLVIKWIPGKRILLTAGFDLVINCYKNLQFDDNGGFKGKFELISMKQQHKEMITDILVMEKQNYIAACDLDGLITLWNLTNFEIKLQLRKHLKGVVGLACIESKNLLFSVGYEHEVFIWDIIVGKNISTLQGHSQSLIGIKIIPNSHQIITGDVSGIFKVWDARTLTLNQTFSIPGSKKTNTFALVNTFKKQIIAGSDKLYYFDYEESHEGNLADSKPCIAVYYNDVFNTFVTAHLDCIKIWESNGELKHVFRDITENEISSLCFDSRKRKLFIGDVDGKLILINILNGVQMKFFEKHKDYISSLVYFDHSKRIISASWDGYIKIHDDNGSDEKGDLLFTLHHSVPGIVNSCNTTAFLGEPFNILASGYDNGNVTLYNMKTLASEGLLPDHKKITHMTFIGQYPAMMVCDSSGIIHFWSLIPTKPKKPNKDFVEENKSFNENNIKEYFPIKSLCFEEKTRYIFSGDETGYVKAWDIGGYISYLEFLKGIGLVYYAEGGATDSDNKTPFTGDITKKFDFVTIQMLKDYMGTLNLKAKLLKEWKAHKNGVTCLSCHSEPIFFVSAGLDCKVFIWNEKFEKIGSLTTIKDPEWNLKIDIEGLLKARYEEAVKTFNEINQIPNFYETLFGGDFRLGPLTEDSMSTDR
jgi:WD40 repeat protein